MHKQRQSTCHNPHVKLVTVLSGFQTGRRPSPMPLNPLAELESKHRALEDEISDALAHPSTDDTKIAELKRRKLQIKDEIARLQHTSVSIH